MMALQADRFLDGDEDKFTVIPGFPGFTANFSRQTKPCNSCARYGPGSVAQNTVYFIVPGR